MVFIANTKSGKLIPTFGNHRFVIVNNKGLDTFLVVNAETGQQLVRNAKFLTKVPHMRKFMEEDCDNYLGEEQPTVSAMVPLEEMETPVLHNDINNDFELEEPVRELSRSTRAPKPKRDADFVYE